MPRLPHVFFRHVRVGESSNGFTGRIQRIGIIQALVSDYECGKLRLTAEMAIRFAMALEVTTDELLRPNGSKRLRRKPSRRVLRRMEKIQELPPRRQYFVLKALDALLSSSTK